MQTTLDENIFAFGDCAACPIAPGAIENVPPRAQAAHQQASLLYKTIKKVVVVKINFLIMSTKTTGHL